MPTLINTHDFAVPGPLGRDLAPYEAVLIEDEEIVRKAIASGVLHSDLEELSNDARKALDGLSEAGRELVATWHREHGRDPLPEVADADGRETPFVSQAQVNHAAGQAKGDQIAADREAGIVRTPELSQDNGESATADAPLADERTSAIVESNPEGDPGVVA